MAQVTRDEIQTGTIGRTWEVQDYLDGYVEFTTEQEARECVVQRLSDTTKFRESLCIVAWSHQPNLPRALPAIRSYSCGMDSYSCGMDSYSLDATGRLAKREIDIFFNHYTGE